MDVGDCVAACVNEVPGSMVHGDMDMANARRYADRGLAERRHDSEVFCSVLNKDASHGQRFGDLQIQNPFL